MTDWLIDHLEGVGAAVTAAVLVAFMIWAIALSSREWTAYAAEHHCVDTGKRTELLPIFTGDGGIFFVDEAIYRCDGGEIRTR